MLIDRIALWLLLSPMGDIQTRMDSACDRSNRPALGLPYRDTVHPLRCAGHPHALEWRIVKQHQCWRRNSLHADPTISCLERITEAARRSWTFADKTPITSASCVSCFVREAASAARAKYLSEDASVSRCRVHFRRFASLMSHR